MNHLHLLIASIFPLAILVLILALVKPWPIWETWTFIDVWQAYLTGGNWLSSLYNIRWGHIHAFPNFIINLVVGGLTSFNMTADVVVTWLAAVLAIIVIFRKSKAHPMLMIGCSTALFTARAAEVWLSSWNLILALLWISISTVLGIYNWRRRDSDHCRWSRPFDNSYD